MDDGPKLVVVGADKAIELKMENEKDDLVSAIVRIAVSNTGTADAILAAETFLEAADNKADGRCTKADSVTETIVGTPPPRIVGKGKTEPVVIKLELKEECANREGTLLLSSGTAPPAEVQFVVPRLSQEEPGYIWAFVAAAVSTVVLVWVMTLPTPKVAWKRELAVDTPWTVADNWLTNIATLGTILGTVVTTTGFLEDWLRGVSLGPVLGLNLLFGALVIVAPVIYSASCTWKWEKKADAEQPNSAHHRWPWSTWFGSQPTTVKQPAATPKDFELKTTGKGWGLLLAASATLAGVLGQLSTVGALIWASSMHTGIKVPLVIALGLAAIVIGRYAYSFAHGTLASLDGEEEPPSSLRGVTVSGPRTPLL